MSDVSQTVAESEWGVIVFLVIFCIFYYHDLPPVRAESTRQFFEVALRTSYTLDNRFSTAEDKWEISIVADRYRVHAFEKSAVSVIESA